MSSEAPDLVIQVFKYLPVVFVIVVIGIVLFNVFPKSEMGLREGVEDICTSQEGLSVLNNLVYDEKTSLVQVMLPEDAETSFTFPRNTFNVLSALQDDVEGNLGEAINLYQGLSNSRKNYVYLDRCKTSSCFCVVKNEMDFFTFRYPELTMCFPRLYSYARSEFDSNFNNYVSTEGETDRDVFEQVIDLTLAGLATDASEEATDIKDCYYKLFDKDDSIYRFYYGASESEHYYLTIDLKESSILAESNSYLEFVTKEVYRLTKAGLFSEISTCEVIPQKNSCFCPYIQGNFIGSKGRQRGIFLGITSSYNSPVSLDIGALILSMEDTNTQNCLIDIDTLPANE
ncbi:MAG: hypothetical protein JW791_00970 [Nanoarchaeota archaeon]|nr:hypothetical protein [Nanoarchaeota archaeon]